MLEVAKTNPDLETMKLAFWIASVIITILIAIVGFFLTQQFRLLKTVAETVNNLKTIVEVIKSRQLGDGEFCRLKHHVIDKRLQEHGKRLDEDEVEIARIQERIKMM